jgi:hypothetical protein
MTIPCKNLPDLESMKYPHWTFDPKWEPAPKIVEELNEEEVADALIAGPEKSEEEILARLILKVREGFEIDYSGKQ